MSHKQVPDLERNRSKVQANRQHATRAPSQPRTPRLRPGSAEKEMRLRLLSLRSLGGTLGRLPVPGGRVGRADHLGCHGTRYVRHGTPEAGTRTQYVQCVMTPGAGRPVPPVRAQRGRLVRVARANATEARGRACQLSRSPGRRCRPGPARCGSSRPRPSAGSTSWPPSRQ